MLLLNVTKLLDVVLRYPIHVKRNHYSLSAIRRVMVLSGPPYPGNYQVITMLGNEQSRRILVSYPSASEDEQPISST
jgi:hypothetical protein